jgi:hypothetical protein
MKNMIAEIENSIRLNVSQIRLLTSQMNAYKKVLRNLVVSHYNYMKSNVDPLPADFPASEVVAQNKYLKGFKPPYVVPKLVSMTRENIPIPEGMAVTDKADGDSCLVMVFNGDVIVFDNSFELLTKVRSIGSTSTSTKLSLFAGEYIRNDKSGLTHDTVYLYDCYMREDEDVRRLNLVSEKADEPTRIRVVNEFVESIQDGEPVIGEGVRIRAK